MFTLSKFPLYRQYDAMQCGVACLHVAGLAALILERNPRLTAAKVREIIARNAKKVGQLTLSCGMAVKQFFLTHVKLSCHTFYNILMKMIGVYSKNDYVCRTNHFTDNHFSQQLKYHAYEKECIYTCFVDGRNGMADDGTCRRPRARKLHTGAAS